MNDLSTRTTLTLHRSPSVDPSAVDVRSRYVDHYWLPTIGPTAVCLGRILVRMVSRSGDAVRIQRDELCSLLGVDDEQRLDDALDRLAEVGIATAGRRSGELLVMRGFPLLTDAQVDALPEPLAAAHRSPDSLLAAANLDGSAEHPPTLGSHLRALSLTASLEEILVNPSLEPSQLARRWQHVVRLAEEARDEAILDWAPSDLEATLAEAHLVGEAMTEALWHAQLAAVVQRGLGSESRTALADAAAGVIDWLVAEFPTDQQAPIDPFDDH